MGKLISIDLSITIGGPASWGVHAPRPRASADSILRGVGPNLDGSWRLDVLHIYDFRIIMLRLFGLYLGPGYYPGRG